ncbi:MAG: 50S ribosomal protein L13 [Bdellovibrionales bacterium]|nr:50S ribosomal protein L13 [Bdellovibrionales bacterium]
MAQQKSFQAQQDGPHAFETKGPLAPKWYVVDAKDQVVGRLATVLANVITGKHKPTYTQHADQGDFVVVLNAEQVVFTRNKWDQKKYFRHSGWMNGGLKVRTAREMLKKDPSEILRQAVWGMTAKSTLSRRQMKKLKIYTGVQHPHSAQNPQPLAGGAVRRTVLAVAR